MGCVESEGVSDGGRFVTLLLGFKPRKAKLKGIVGAVNLKKRRKLWKQQSKKKRKQPLGREKKESENGEVAFLTSWRTGVFSWS